MLCTAKKKAYTTTPCHRHVACWKLGTSSGPYSVNLGATVACVRSWCLAKVLLKESSRQRPWSAMLRKTPGEVRARTCSTKSPSRSEALRFIDSSKSPSTKKKIDGPLVNFRRRLSNRHGRPRRMLIWTFEGNTDQTVNTST